MSLTLAGGTPFTCSLITMHVGNQKQGIGKSAQNWAFVFGYWDCMAGARLEPFWAT